MRKNSKKPIAIAITALLLVGAGGAAFAYWTNQGSGSGSGSSGTNEAVTINQTSTIENVNPGAAAQPISGDFTNTNDGPVYVNDVTVVLTVAKAADAPAGECTTADYTLSNASMSVDAEIPVGTNQGTFSGATIAFNNTTANQDGCKNAVLTFTYTSN